MSGDRDGDAARNEQVEGHGYQLLILRLIPKRQGLG